MYPLLRVALLLMLGVVIGDAVDDVVSSRMWYWAYALAVVAAIVVWKVCRGFVVQTSMIYIAIVLLGAWRVGVYNESMTMEYTDATDTFEAVVVSRPTMRPATVRYELVVVDGRLAGKRMQAYFDKDVKLAVGDGLVAESRLMPPMGNNRWSRVHGIVASGFVRDGHWQRAVVDMACMPRLQILAMRLSALRDRLLRHHYEHRHTDESYALVAAMTLGDKTSLTSRMRDVYSVSGASHVLALSGLHLGVVYVLLSMLFSIRRHPILGNLAVIGAMWGYALMVGLPASVGRSATMYTMLAMAAMVGRQHVSLNTLGMAAILLLMLNPLSLWDVGFQMSFLAVAGILLLHGSMYSWIPCNYLQSHRLLKWIWSMITVSLAAQIAVLPLVAHYFGRISCYFMLSNFIAIPLATLIIYMSLAMYALFFLPWLQNMVSDVVGYLATAMNEALAWVATLPGACIDNVRFSVAQILVYYVAVALLCRLFLYLTKMYGALKRLRLMNNDEY